MDGKDDATTPDSVMDVSDDDNDDDAEAARNIRAAVVVPATADSDDVEDVDGSDVVAIAAPHVARRRGRPITILHSTSDPLPGVLPSPPAAAGTAADNDTPTGRKRAHPASERAGLQASTGGPLHSPRASLDSHTSVAVPQRATAPNQCAAWGGFEASNGDDDVGVDLLGPLLTCDVCGTRQHVQCAMPGRRQPPRGTWRCTSCVRGRPGPVGASLIGPRGVRRARGGWRA